LKIPVSAVRFRPWALKEAANPADFDRCRGRWGRPNGPIGPMFSMRLRHRCGSPENRTERLPQAFPHGRQWAERVATVALVLLATTCEKRETPVVKDTLDSRFHVGERWDYRTRQGEEKSALTIVKVETTPKLGVIVHVSLDGLRIKSAHAPSGFSETVSHMPFADAAIEKSVTTLAAAKVSLPAFQEGYDEWRRAFDAGKGGVFTSTVAEGVDFIETALNR